MLRLPIFRFVPALLASLPLAALAQAPVDSVVRTTTVVTTTTTTVTKPAAPGSKPSAPVTTSSSTTTTTAEPATGTTTAPTARPGDLTGARPRSSSASTTTTTTAAKPTATASKPAATASKPKTSVPAASAAARTTGRRPADPEVVRFLQTDVDLTLVRADQLPNLYERFMETTRAERRQWNTAQWASASAMLSRLNQRYEQVRGELSLEEKLNIRTLQGEFRGLEAAKQVSKRL